jgi:hypothetical protein
MRETEGRSLSACVLALAVAWVFLLSTLTLTREARATERLRVRGEARLATQAIREATSPSGTDVVLSGTLTDDAAAPLPHERVLLRLKKAASPDSPGNGAITQGPPTAAFSHPHGCSESEREHEREIIRVLSQTELAVMTDDAGRFCVRTTVSARNFAVTYSFGPEAAAPLVDGVEKQLVIDASRRGVELRFDPTPSIVSLDSAVVSFDVVALYTDATPNPPAQDLPLRVSLDGRELASVVTDAGRAHVSLSAKTLGPPGLGELWVSFDGNETADAASIATPIERRARVQLTPPPSPLEVHETNDGISFDVTVRTRSDIVDEGTVEARVDGNTVGAGTVRQGVAAVHIPSRVFDGERLSLKLRYVPTSSWLEPEGEPPLELRLPSNPSRARLPLLLSGAAVLGLFVLARLGSRARVLPPKGSVRDDEGMPRIETVPTKIGEKADGWSGLVLDAHDGTPLSGARVWIERGTFAGSEIVADSFAGTDGSFRLPNVERATGELRLAAESRHHARFAQPLPPAGTIRIALASHRRMLLSELVRWARKRGLPYDATPEPTPLHIRRAASQNPSTAKWATAVERAAFGPDPMDAQTASQIAAMQHEREPTYPTPDPSDADTSGPR